MQHHPLPEYLVAERQAELGRELRHNQLLREAENARAYHQSLVGQWLHAFSLWLMRVGEQLHERYHVSPHLPDFQK